jgi:integrase
MRLAGLVNRQNWNDKMSKKSSYRTKDGYFRSLVSLGGGKYKYFYAKTQKEAERKANDFKINLEKFNVSGASKTLGDWVYLWLDDKKSSVSEKRYNSYKSSLNHFQKLFSENLRDLRQADFQKIFNIMSENYAKSSVNNAKIALHGVYKNAIGNRVTDYNPIDYITIGGNSSEKRKPITLENRKMIIETPHRAQTAAMIMLFAGLRRGELLALQWSDIDIKKGAITVNKSAKMLKGKLQIIPGAKSDAGNRVVWIVKPLADYLQTVEKTSDLVCPKIDGSVMTETAFKRLWESYMSCLNWKYGNFENTYITGKGGKIVPFVKPESIYAPEKVPFVIDRFTPHMLRHSYITMLFLSGVDVVTAKCQAGHADISTTLNIYTHLTDEHAADEIEKVNSFLLNENRKHIPLKSRLEIKGFSGEKVSPELIDWGNPQGKEVW